MDNLELKTARELGQLLRRKTKIKECLHPHAPQDCKGKIVKAHTVQRSMLKTIAQNNHVYTPSIDYDAVDRPFCMESKGLKQASTFTGFCGLHDNELFAPIEKRALEINEHHSFLLAYRSMAKELYNNKSGSPFFIFDANAHESRDPTEKTIAGIYVEGEENDEYVMQDFVVFAKMGIAYDEDNYDGTRYFAIELNCVPDMLCSGTTNVEFDFNGNRLQSVVQAERQDLITLSLLPFRNTSGVAVFTWYGQSSVNERFIRSLLSLPEYDIPNAIVRFIFQHFENFFAAPRWWDNLSPPTKKQLIERFESTFYLESYVFIDLSADGMDYVDWKVTNIKTNLKL